MAQDDPDAPQPLRRSAATAFLASLLVPGLGHWYVGSIRVAVGFALVLVCGLPLALVSMAALGLYVGIWLVVAGSWVLRLLAAVDAARIAKAGRGVSSPAQTTNGYALFFVVTAGLQLLTVSVSREYVLDTAMTSAESMTPTLQDGDHLTIAKFTERDRVPQRGDVVVYAFGKTQGARMVHRVIGLPGETLLLPVGGPPSIDGVPMTWTPVDDESRFRFFVETTPEGAQYEIRLFPTDPIAMPPDPIVVPEGTVFVIGDNRHGAHDSRAIGPVPLSAIVGRAVERYWPPGRTGSLIPEG